MEIASTRELGKHAKDSIVWCCLHFHDLSDGTLAGGCYSMDKTMGLWDPKELIGPAHLKQNLSKKSAPSNGYLTSAITNAHLKVPRTPKSKARNFSP